MVSDIPHVAARYTVAVHTETSVTDEKRDTIV